MQRNQCKQIHRNRKMNISSRQLIFRHSVILYRHSSEQLPSKVTMALHDENNKYRRCDSMTLMTGAELGGHEYT